MSAERIPLPKFLKLLTDNQVPVPKAMSAAGKIYKEYYTRNRIAELNDLTLQSLGLSDKETRRQVLSAFRKAGYVPMPSTKRNIDAAGPSTSPKPESKRRRKRTNDDKSKNPYLPSRPLDDDEASNVGSMDFNEVLDESVLVLKTAVINRAPVMAAWATVVLECMGFQREEALSIAAAYTEMNAISKGIALGIYDQSMDVKNDAVKGGSQSYVELMGRSPVFKTQGSGQWRALLKGAPASPSTPYSYITRSFRQTTPYIVGALRLLATSFPPEVLPKRAWDLYSRFRPESSGWGKRAQLSCGKVLALRWQVDNSASGRSGASGETAATSRQDNNIGEPDTDKNGEHLTPIVVEEPQAPTVETPPGECIAVDTTTDDNKTD
ncbi:hypothetical protein FISHEDRAFT_72618 [Fistulina hepatica ATCC 64428]|nr:hypothetical protein FISHEDRAFT_72618 [Fistulina hepatica ATCC 64428]